MAIGFAALSSTAQAQTSESKTSGLFKKASGVLSGKGSTSLTNDEIISGLKEAITLSFVSLLGFSFITQYGLLKLRCVPISIPVNGCL